MSKRKESATAAANHPAPVTKTGTLKFDDDGYPGFECEIWLNPPVRLVNQFHSTEQSEEESRKLALQFFPSWNFVDAEGKAIPHTVEGCDEIPQDLMYAMVTRRLVAVSEAARPNLGMRSSRPPNRETRRAAARRNGASGTS